MSLKKFGTGDGKITQTEGPMAKVAKKDDWTDDDEQALARENAKADKEGD